MAGEGEVLVAEDGQVFEEPAPKGRLVNGVGAGDSMVAGFVAVSYTHLNGLRRRRRSPMFSPFWT